MHLSQQKFFDLLSTHICILLLHSADIPRISTHNPLRAGGLFHFKKDHSAYSIKAEDYETKPHFASSKENRPPRAARGAALGLRRQRVARHRQRRSRSDNEEASDLISVITPVPDGNPERADVAKRGPNVRHTPSKTSKLQPAAARFSHRPSSRLLACAGGYTHIEIIHDPTLAPETV